MRGGSDVNLAGALRLPQGDRSRVSRHLATEGLTKSYRGRTVVRNVDIRIHPGEVVGLLGPNGAGKTTTFYGILGLVAPDEGRVLLDGEDVTARPWNPPRRWDPR